MTQISLSLLGINNIVIQLLTGPTSVEYLNTNFLIFLTTWFYYTVSVGQACREKYLGNLTTSLFWTWKSYVQI